MKVYLDYAATTPLDKKVFEAMKPYFGKKFGNPSSLHNFGKEASEAAEKARKQSADFFGALPEEIIFTSGATESNNFAIKGVVKVYYLNFETKPHIITTAFEHHCVLNVCKTLEKENLAEVTYIKPNSEGIIEVEKIKKAIKQNTILISVMYVNNEIGTVQPIKEIGKVVKKYNYKLSANSHKLLFHTDATQAVNYFDCDVNKLGVDLLSMSGHKIYGPKGIGILYLKKGARIKRIQDGGEQEFRLRAGTLNVPGIVGLTQAISQLATRNLQHINKNILELRNYLIEKVLKEIPGSKLNGSKIKRSPNNANFSFENLEGESLLLMLNKEGIACSTGSACSSSALKPSHTLLAIGLKPEQVHGSLRMTLGKYTTKSEIDYAIKVLKKSVEKLRKISGKILEDYYANKY